MRLHWIQQEVDARCPICGAEGAKGSVLVTDHVLPGHPEVTLLRCPACGVAFLQDLTPPAYESEMADLLDYYVEQGAGIDLIVAPLQRLPPGRVRRCLEVGCSFGFALDFSRHVLGWEVLGVDPSPLAAAGAEALGFPVRRTYFNAELDLGPEPFDVVICSEVLEHIATPHELLAAIRDRLSPEGVLVLSTPNLAVIRPEVEEGALGRALSPGLHLVLYDRRSLIRVLEDAGFAAVRVEESPETLRAFAALSPATLERLRPANPVAERALLRRYFEDRAASASPASAVACGFAYRHFKECVNAGLYEEAVESRARLERVYQERFGLDLKKPDLPDRQSDRSLPFNLTGALFFSGILELNALGNPVRAADCFAAALVAGHLLQAEQNPLGLRDGETEALLAQSQKHLPMALAATDPDRAVAVIEGLERARPGEGLSAALLAEARAQTFVRLVNAGAYEGAERLAPGVARQTGMEGGGGVVPAVGAELLDSLYCLGMLALQRERPEDATQLFGRVHRLAGRRAEIYWPARFHEGLSLRRAGHEEPAREALAEVAGGDGPKSGGGRDRLPPVPLALAEAARSLLGAGPAERRAAEPVPQGVPQGGERPRVLSWIIAERFVSPVARLSEVVLPLDVVALRPASRLGLFLLAEGSDEHRAAVLSNPGLSPQESLRLEFAPFSAPAESPFLLGVLDLSEEAKPLADADLQALRDVVGGRPPIVLDCRSEGEPAATDRLNDERAIAAFRVASAGGSGVRAVHGLDVFWCDANGLYLRGWVHAHEHRVRALRLESSGRCARVDTFADRPDLLAFYPEHEHVRHGGFTLYLACPPGHPVSLVLETDGGMASVPLVLPEGPLPVWPEDRDVGGDVVSPMLRRFVDFANERGGRVLQVGARTPAGFEGMPPRPLLRGPVVGLDIHPGLCVDLVGDAHFLSRFLRERSFDAVVSGSVLEHLQAPWLFAAEVNRILKVGGLVYHEAPGAWPAHAQPNDFWRMSAEGLRVLFGPECGFEVLDAQDAGPAAMIPVPKWRQGHLDMPTVPTFAAAEILARKVAEIKPGAVAWPQGAGASEERARRYPVAGLRVAPAPPGETS
jgi:2-polyprenyl-3-methyl-5-hydroxy-6-metoxy-1,4-benzoquinol methylase